MGRYLNILDFDGGCNSRTGGPGVPWDLSGMDVLATTIAEVPKGFGVCLLTGRGAQYGLAVAEALGLVKYHSDLWSGFEGGLVMAQHRSDWSCELTTCVIKEYLEAREDLDITLTAAIKKRGGMKEKKEVCLTYNPPDDMSLDELLKLAQEFVENLHLTELVNCTRTNSAVDIWPLGGSKKNNILELCHKNGVDPKNTLYIDDASSGIPVFEVVGYSGAPFTDSKDVWKAVQFRTPDLQSAPMETAWVIKSFVSSVSKGFARQRV